MKTKLLFTGILSATLLLGACGNEEESKTEDKKETVKADSDKQKDKEKQDKDKEKQDKEKAKKDEQQDQSVEQTQQTNEQQATTEPTQEQTQDDAAYQDYLNGKKQQIEAGVVPGEGYMNTDEMPNGDAMFDMPGSADGYYSNDQLDPETGLPKDDAIPHKVGEGPTDAEIAQGEKEALREKYNGGLSSGEMQTKTAIEKGYYDGDDADEVMKEIEQSEAEIANGDYDQYKE